MSTRVMTKTTTLLAVILASTLLMTLLWCPVHAESSDSTLTFVASQHPPWHFKGRNGKLVGINVDLAKEICRRMGFESEFLFMPWARGWESILSGDADAIMSASRKKTRLKYLYYPETDFRMSEYVFFVHKHKLEKTIQGTYDEIAARHFTVGIQIGASYDPDFWKHFPLLGQINDVCPGQTELS